MHIDTARAPGAKVDEWSLVGDGNVNMGAEFAHSAKSVKLGTHVHWTLLFDEINEERGGLKIEDAFLAAKILHSFTFLTKSF